jgi:double-stranded uracil-DNA glycosylase
VLLRRAREPVLAHTRGGGPHAPPAAPEEFATLPSYGIGLTDMAKHVAGMDRAVRIADFDVEGFRERIVRSAPKVLAFNGKKAAAVYLGLPTGSLTFGLLSERLGEIELFVLPSTSGAASRYWIEVPWRTLADHLGRAPVQSRSSR